MKKNHIISLALTLIMTVLCLSSCGGIKKLEDMRVTSANVVSIIPNGLRGVSLNLQAGIDNPGTQVSLSEISCDIKHSGKILGKVAVDPFTLHAKTAGTYDLKADLRLGDGMTLMDLGKLLDKSTLDNATVDFSAKVQLRNGAARDLKFNDIPLKKLIETAKR